MFPYIDASHWRIAGHAFDPFLALVAIALGVGYTIAAARARRSGIGGEHFAKLALCVMVTAIVGGHLAKFVYMPGSFHDLLEHPSLALQIPNGQASFGGFLGGYFAAVAFLWWHSMPYYDWFVYADAGCFAVPFAWWIGRVGCYLAHDHPGIRTSSLLGVRYPGGTRFDLGLLEALFLIALALLFLFLDRRPRPRGFYYVAFLFSYGLFRVLVDRLHVDPPSYGGWTVDQLGGTLMIVTAAITIFDLKRRRRAERIKV